MFDRFANPNTPVPFEFSVQTENRVPRPPSFCFPFSTQTRLHQPGTWVSSRVGREQQPGIFREGDTLTSGVGVRSSLSSWRLPPTSIFEQTKSTPFLGYKIETFHFKMIQLKIIRENFQDDPSVESSVESIAESNQPAFRVARR